MEYLFTVFLVFFSALFSGMTLGLMSLSKDELQRKAELGDRDAIKVYPIRHRGNLLLVTLLLGNVIVNTVLSVFLGSITTGVIAVVVATGLIVIFGEILPQAICARYGLYIGARIHLLVKFFMILLSPVAWPLSRILDKLLGDELPQVYSKEELKKIVEFHEDSPHSEVDRDEERVLLGALTYSDKTARDTMTQWDDVYYMNLDGKLDQNTLKEIQKEGYTRIPVLKNDEPVGIVLVKDLIAIPVKTAVKSIYRKRQLVFVPEETKLDDLLNRMIRLRAHLAFVTDQNEHIVGIVSLEDILEEILGREIIDEHDADDLRSAKQ